MSEENICQVCEKTYPDWPDDTWDKYPVPYDMHPVSMSCCSWPCFKVGLRFNGAWNFKEKIRNMQGMPLETFSELFGFGLEGNYAKEKHELMRTSPWLFICSLSQDKFLRVLR